MYKSYVFKLRSHFKVCVTVILYIVQYIDIVTFLRKHVATKLQSYLCLLTEIHHFVMFFFKLQENNPTNETPSLALADQMDIIAKHVSADVMQQGCHIPYD